MQLLPMMDNILYNVQRQGKISFYVRYFHHSSPKTDLIKLSPDDLCETTFVDIRGTPDHSPSMARKLL